MPIDEFGREIQATRGGGDRHHSNSFDHHLPPPHHHHHHRSSSPPSSLPHPSINSSSSSSSSHHNSHHHHYNTNSHNSHHSYHSQSRQHNHRSSSSRHHHSTSSSHYQNHSSSSSSSSRNNTNNNSSSTSGNNNNNNNNTINTLGVLEKYVREPMLCEFVWKDRQPSNQQQQQQNDGDDPMNTQGLNDASQMGDLDHRDDVLAPGETTTSSSKQQQQQQQRQQTYDEYRQSYCLTYIRSFFNEHMDDTWFRHRYSPLERVKAVQLARERSQQEALQIWKTILMEDQQQQHDASTRKFVQLASLDGGSKRPVVSTAQAALTVTSGMKRKGSFGDQDSADTPSSTNTNPIPKSHLHGLTVLKIIDIPPYVTEQQIQYTLQRHLPSNKNNNSGGGNNSSSTPLLQIFSGPVQISGSGSDSSSSTSSSSSQRLLHREAVCVLENEETKQQLMHNLLKATVESKGHIPRKDDDDRKTLDLDVDCSDPYGRVDVMDGTVPHRKAVVTLILQQPQQHGSNSSNNDHSMIPRINVLSVSLSSKQRIPSDKNAAILMARALDMKCKISSHATLDSVLEKLQPLTEVQALDVAIAYLRRVHLLNFYNQCKVANNVMQGLVQPIFLRLENADEILEKAAEANDLYGDVPDEIGSGKTDLLVKRLDDAIQRALKETTSEWHEYCVSEEIDGQALEIEALEKQSFADFMAQNGIVDQDGRARCSFPFCRKLFKDETFLQKHLLKKHSDQLLAEKAKCHDRYMMMAWDVEEVRPVPPVLVDCGSNFGFVKSPVIGAAVPVAEDPEPALWQKEEERRKKIQEEQERRHQQQQQQQRQRDDEVALSSSSTPRRSKHFVDVDDMKEEKVELKFEEAEIPVQPPKKKKKKKKLL